MSATEHKRVFRRLINEGFNDGRLAVLDELVTADGAAGDHRYLTDSNCRLTSRAAGLYTDDLGLLSL